MARQTRARRGGEINKQSYNFSKTGVEFLGPCRREICVDVFGAVNHRPNFLAQMSRLISRTCHNKSSRAKSGPGGRFRAPVLSQFAGFPLCSLSAFETPRNRLTPEAQSLLGTPRLSLIACHKFQANRYHTCDQDERQMQGTKVLRTN